MIGTWLLEDVVIDPGPSSCLPTLLPYLERNPPRAIVLTHIHLDHAGSAGSLARRFPDAEVWVHERGARHLVDPSRLLASATRLYGDAMHALWGEVEPVPQERLRVLRGAESLGPFRVAYTPGHACHHVSYLHEPSGWAFAGDVAGVRITDERFVLAPTPPPDIDLPAWRASLELLRGWNPTTLALTHFGSYSDVRPHLDVLSARLTQMEVLAGAHDQGGFAAAMRADVAAEVSPESVAAYEQAMSPEQSYQGLARYLGKT